MKLHIIKFSKCVQIMNGNNLLRLSEYILPFYFECFSGKLLLCNMTNISADGYNNLSATKTNSQAPTM